MAFETLLFDCADGVARITLNRPERLNALSGTMLAELRQAVEQAGRDEGVRVLLLTGAGRAFCSGADLQDGAAAAQPPGERLRELYNPLIRAMAALEKPIVVAVNGIAAGAGCSIALAGDFVLAARSACFLQAFVNIGLVPDAGATAILPRLVGAARAAEMMMLGERISAEKAESWGMIHRATDDAALMDEADALAARFAAGPTRAYGLIRRGLGRALEQSLAETLEMEAAHQNEAAATADFREGVAAFLHKRPARFTGA